jgi:quinol monooxygenase YgiN
MSIRLIVEITAAPGKGSELAKLYKPRCEEIMKEPGCEQFEVFQSVVNPDRLTLLERWTDQAALDVHRESERDARAAAGGIARGHDSPRGLHVQSHAVARGRKRVI